MNKYIQVHISGKEFDIDSPSDKRKTNYHYYIKRDGTLIFLKDLNKKNKHPNPEGIDILLSGGNSFTVDTIFTLKHIIHQLRIQGDLPLIINTDNFNYLQNVFQIF